MSCKGTGIKLFLARIHVSESEIDESKFRIHCPKHNHVCIQEYTELDGGFGVTPA